MLSTRHARERQITAASVALTVTLFSGCSIVGGHHIETGEQSERSYSTVAGDIHVENGASIHDARTVAGDIRVDAHSSTSDLKTVAGDISLGVDATVEGNVRNVAGDIDVRNGALITGDLTTEAGDIQLEACTVEGAVRIDKGSISTKGTNLPGGIVVEETRMVPGEPTRITIGPGSSVASVTVHPDTYTILRISESADVGPIHGVEPEYF